MTATSIVVADIGGTNARFALAHVEPGRRPLLGEARRYRTADHPGVASAWAAFAADVAASGGGALPVSAAIAVAAPIEEAVLRFVNNPWTVDRGSIAAELGLERLLLLNDFGAAAHAVALMEPTELAWISGPQGPLPHEGVTSVIGPGTGLGVAMLVRRGGKTMVVETEGAHIGFAPVSEEERRLSVALAERFGRASVERVVAGPGLHDLYRFFGGRFFEEGDAAALWSAAIEGREPAAEQALEQFVKAFGSAAGDLALAHGSNAVVLASALSQRLAPRLRSPLFVGRFIAKGRYRARMERIPVRLALHPEPGLLGAAAAFLATLA